MNRRWPIVAAWSLLVATTISAILNAFTGAPRIITAVLAASTGFVWLCQRRYFQHVLGGVLPALVVLGTFFAAEGPLKISITKATILYGVLVGCRGAAQRLLAFRANSDGMHVLWLASVFFGLSRFLLWVRETNGEFVQLHWRLIAIPVVSTLIGALVQFVAAMFLVKTIPEAKQDERPAIALWLVLLVWLIAAPAR